MGKKIVGVDVLDVEKRRVPSKHYVYVILVKWSDGCSLTIFRRYSRFFDLQARLLDQFPIEGGTIAPEKRIIPFLPGKIFFGRSHVKDVAMKRLDDIKAYCKSLIKLPAHISECDEVIEFFEVEPEDLDPPSVNSDEGKKRLSLSLSLNSLSKSKSSKDNKVAQISKPKRLDRYVAVAEYEVKAPGEMLLYPGLRVDVLEKSDSGWWFVNSEDEQGWVPSTYLEPESEESVSVAPAAIAEPGQEENFICIERFEGASSDEVSLEKGAVVQVLQKNMDGWWLVRYQGREAYAPGTYLKKATSGQTHALVEKSRLSGVQIISSLQDVSTLLNQDKKVQKDKPQLAAPNPVKSSGSASAFVKTKSLERGGSLIPPPRQNSVTKVEFPISVAKPSVYVTIEDFQDTVGDGLSFKTGQTAYVKEKTPAGWWFVEINGQEGWVPASYLESTQNEQENDFQSELSSTFQDDEFEDEDWYDHPDVSEESEPVRPGENSKGYMDMAKRPLPPIPSNDEPNSNQSSQASESPRMAHRPLPAAPGPAPPKAGTRFPTAIPAAPAPVPPKCGPVLPTPKKPSDLIKSNETPNAQKAALPGGNGGDQDFAAMLKAKLAARSGAGADSGNSSDEDSSKPTKQMPLKPKPQQVLSKKPSECKKDIEEVNRVIGLPTKGGTSPGQSPPPFKNKPLRPPTVPAKPGGAASSGPQPSFAIKPGFPAVQLKPVNKQGVLDVSDSKNSNNGPMVPLKNTCISEISQGISKLKPVTDKPLVPGKKPSTATKPTVANKPSIAAQKPGKNVSNLANNLGGKLNLGKGQVDGPPMEAVAKPAVLPKNSSGLSGSISQKTKNYVALFDFTAENDDEISFNEGDDLEVLDQQGDWSYVRIWDDEGWAPTAYLEKS